LQINNYQNYHETKQHTTAEFPYNTYPCSIPLDFTRVPLHWHDELELIVIKKGHGLISVDFQKKIVNAGDIIFIRPGCLHSIEQHESDSMEYENILLLPELLISGDNDLCATQFLRPLMSGSVPVEIFFTPAVPCHGQLTECICQIDLLCETRPDGWQLALKGYLFQFFYILISNQKKKEHASSPRLKSLEKMKLVLRYVEEHYTEPVSIEDMVALTYYSKSHFMKFFKLHMGTGFIEYLNDYRLTIAGQKLKNSSDSVLTIAEECGFEHLSYFNRLFKRKYGTTPGKYRSGLH
jgi:AraC-like DNA-binding protein/mannose-6-phosphate isomerase-like protein (cupin superfamily)